jgi:arylformamidase
MLYDISPPIDARLAVWPGDTPPAREVLLDRHRGDNITLSTLRATVHLGAHADAFSHVEADAPSIEARPLEDYLGPCDLVRVHVGRNERVGMRHLDLESISTERLLIATGTYPDPRAFSTDFAAIEPSLVEALHQCGVRLIGIDTPSVDLFDSKDLPTHQTFVRLNIAILEGLVLTSVPEGRYELIALPLRLVGYDASPIRAVLRSLDG